MAEDKKTIGILGGTGLMGRWFETYFKDLGHRVLICGRKTDLTPDEVARQSDVVMLSMPLAAAVEEAARIGPLLREDQALMDLCSLKIEICQAMAASTRAEVVGTHPLFGPNTQGMSGQNVILCPMRGSAWHDWLARELESGGAVVTSCDPATHDRNMAIVQGLTHFVTIVLGRTLQDMGLKPGDLIPFATPIFRLKLNLVGRLFAQDLALFTDLISENPKVLDVVSAFIRTAEDTGEAFHGQNPGQGTRLLEEIREHLGDFPARAKAESDACLNTVAREAKKNG